MSYVENILRSNGISVRDIPIDEWVPREEREAMRDEMRSQFAKNESYRRRSERAVKR